jgi:DNA-binding beta-propeller fold protein YncE
MTMLSRRRSGVSRLGRRKTLVRARPLTLLVLFVAILDVVLASQVSDVRALSVHPAYSPNDGASLPGNSPVLTSIPVGNEPQGAAFDSSTGDVYVTGSPISVIAGTSPVASIPIQGWAATFDPSNGYMYVTSDTPYSTCPDEASSCVAVINGTSVIATIELGTDPTGPLSAAFDPSDGDVYVSEAEATAIVVIHGTSVIGSIELPGNSDPRDIAFDSSDGYVYVAASCISGLESPPGCVEVIEGTSIVATIQLPGIPWGATFDSVDGWVYVSAVDAVYVINGTSLVTTIYPQSEAANLSPSGVVFDSTNDYVYALWEPPPFGVGGITVISGTSSIEWIPLGSPQSVSGLQGATFDPTNGLLYATYEYGSNATGEVWLINGTITYPTITSFVAVPDMLVIGSPTASTTTFEVTSTRGEGPSNFTYSDLPSGCLTANTSDLNCTPDLPGVYVVHILVTDSEGNNATAMTTVTVVAPPKPASGGPQSVWSFLESPLFVGGTLAAVALLLVVIAVKLGLRHGPSSESDLSPEYRVSPKTGAPPGPAPVRPSQQGVQGTPSGPTGGESIEKDSVDDLE